MLARALPALLAALSANAFAQNTQRAPAPYTYEIQTRDRWLNARQQPRFTPTERVDRWISIDSVVVDSAARTRTLFTRTRMRNQNDRVTTALDGTPRGLAISRTERPPLGPGPHTWRDSLRTRNYDLVNFDGSVLRLPASRVWDVVPVFRPPRLAPGVRWTDTLALSDTLYGNRQSIAGLRTHTLVRDTLIDGRQLWIVRDSAVVRYDDRHEFEERHINQPVNIVRRATGFIAGQSLYDASLGLFRARTDTSALTGTAELRYPDGRVFPTATRFERSRRWMLYDTAALSARERQIAAQRDSNSFSIVAVPRNALEERVSAGDTATVDSLYRVWRLTRDANQRTQVMELLSHWTRDSASTARYQAARVAEGDTAFLLTDYRRREGRWITLQDVQFRLPFLRNPGLAFQFGVDRDVLYENYVEELAWDPPALEPDTSKWICEPAACRLLGEQWRTATEPDVRGVGLAVLTLVDPRRWRDTFLVHAAEHYATGLALSLVGGHSSVRGPRRGTGIPPVGADWLAWVDWLGVPRPSDPQPPVRGMRPGSPPLWTTASGDGKSLRFVALATQRDVVSELQLLFRTAPSDTASVVIGNILSELGALPLTLDSIAEYMRGSSQLMRTFAIRRLSSMFYLGARADGPVSPADSALTDTLQDQLLTGITNKRSPWRTLEEYTANQPAGSFRAFPTDAPGATHPVHYVTQSLSEATRAKWSTQVSTLTGAEWSARSSREGGEAWTISGAQRRGQFAVISVSVSGRIARRAEQGPVAWGSWTTYYLMLVNGEWVIVTTSSAVT